MKKISMIMFIICFMQLKASDSPPMSYSPTGRRIFKSVSAASQLGRLLQEETLSPREQQGKVMRILRSNADDDILSTKLTQLIRRKSVNN